MKHSAVKAFYKYKIPLNSLLAWEVCVNSVKQFLRQNIILESSIWEIFFFFFEHQILKSDFLLKGLCL